MLETPEERIRLLKKGISGKTIEMMYIKYNNFRIVNTPVFVELLEFDIPQDKKTWAVHEVAAEYT